MELISEFRDHFCAQLDNAQTGIRATIRRLMSVLQQCDFKLWYHIEVECKVGRWGGPALCGVACEREQPWFHICW